MGVTYRSGHSDGRARIARGNAARHGDVRAACGIETASLVLSLIFAITFIASFAKPVYAGQDSDGIPDTADNCVQIANPDQRDSDDDGIGNACDPDLNNDGIVDARDRSLLYGAFYGTSPVNDLNGDGYVNFGDLGILYSLYNRSPGPTGIRPQITLLSPADGLITDQPDLTITGSLNIRAALTINSAPLGLNPDRSFSATTTLQPGPNAYQLTATSVTGATTQQGLSITYEPATVTINATLISIGPVVNGQVSVTGQAGSVPAGAQVTITNFDTGATITVTASADGSFSATIAAQDSQALGITATDTGNGASDAISKPVGNILGLSVTSPLNGDTLNSDLVSVSGTFNGRPNVGISVNGVTACIVGTNYYANNVPLTAGQGAIAVTGTIADGVTVAESIQVTSTAEAAIKAEVAPACGIAPLDVSFVVTDTAGGGIQTIAIDFDNNGSVDYSSTDGAAPITHIYAAEGVYAASVVVTDAAGTQHTSTHAIVAGSVQNMDAMLRSIYNGMRERLRIGAIDGAVNALNDDVRQKYRRVFEDLAPSLSTVVDQLGTIVDGAIFPEFAQYTIVQDHDGVQRAYFLEFLRGDDGVWRISGM
ncbi:MAG: putative outer membrane adhesin-like protein [Gammaproteobacteria bacterium]|nr:MAG: putative outer membrane adhesin-like protein [Gammaproteobacteria bacterium]TND06982.1 MAG: putative outer membrane adhesin-like protein [Gammaproteobacteria bacterium]